MLKRFKRVNEGQPWSKQIKPFNFFLVGFQVIEDDGKPIKPIAPFSNDPQKIVFDSFINKYTGDIMQGPEFFKSLNMTILQYADHPEYKYEGDIGPMNAGTSMLIVLFSSERRLTTLMTSLWIYGRLKFFSISRT